MQTHLCPVGCLNRVFFQYVERHNIQRPSVGRLKKNLRRCALVRCLQETHSAKTPLVTGLQPCELKLWPRRRKIISHVFGIGQKFGGHHRTDCMAAVIFSAGIAMTVAKETG